MNLDPTAFLMCSGCGHIASEPGPHMGMPAMGLECPRGGSSFYAINMADEGQALLWRRYVAEAAATYAACPECGGTGRVRGDGRLQRHSRERRPSDGRGRRPVECEGSGRKVEA